MMRPAFLVVAAFLAAFAAPVAGAAAPRSNAPSRADWQAIGIVVKRQLSAFQHENAAQAFYYAAPAVRRHYGSAWRFMSVVRRDYAPVYRPREARLLDPYLTNGRPVQPVRLRSTDGETLVALFLMERQPDGRWKVAGLALPDAPLVSG